MGWGDLATGSVLFAGLLPLAFIDPAESPRWTRVNGFDARMRGFLRVSDHRTHAIATASDVLLYTIATYPVLVEDFGIVMAGDRNPRLAAEMLAIDAQAYATMTLLVGIAKLSSARERPYANEAGCADGSGSPQCDGGRNLSFFSGHAAMAFTGAGLVCFHRQQLPQMYGTRGAGVFVCTAALAMASTTSILRVMSDRHWTSDVLVGTGIGLFSGWLMPWLTHGRAVIDLRTDDVNVTVTPLLAPNAYGVGAQGTWR